MKIKVECGVGLEMLKSVLPQAFWKWINQQTHRKKYIEAIKLFLRIRNQKVDRGTALHRAAGTYGLEDREFDQALTQAGL